MDPNTALENILRGHLVRDHVEALQGWLAAGGFKPEPARIPVDCHEAFAGWFKDLGVLVEDHGIVGWSAQVRSGFTGRDRTFISWAALLRLTDSEF